MKHVLASAGMLHVVLMVMVPAWCCMWHVACGGTHGVVTHGVMHVITGCNERLNVVWQGW